MWYTTRPIGVASVFFSTLPVDTQQRLYPHYCTNTW
jgi:hypothetical protein